MNLNLEIFHSNKDTLLSIPNSISVYSQIFSIFMNECNLTLSINYYYNYRLYKT